MTHNPIRAARAARGWSQARLISELARAANAHGVPLMNPASLRVALSRWENGHVQPAGNHRQLLQRVLGVELAGPDGNDGAEPAGQLLTMPQLESQAEILDAIRRSDRLGCTFMTNPQLNTYSIGLRASLRAGAPLDIRLRLASILADADSLIAWQLLDLGHPGVAFARYQDAERYATMAEDAQLTAHARAGQAVTLIDLGRFADAYSLMRATRRQADGKVTPLFSAWLSAATAETAAAADYGAACRDSLRRAFDELPADDQPEPSLPFITLTRTHLQRWAGHALSLLGERDALDVLGQAAHTMPSDFIRARGSLHTDLARCHALLGHRTDAAREQIVALELVRTSGSRRQRRRLAELKAA